MRITTGYRYFTEQTSNKDLVANKMVHCCLITHFLVDMTTTVKYHRDIVTLDDSLILLQKKAAKYDSSVNQSVLWCSRAQATVKHGEIALSKWHRRLTLKQCKASILKRDKK